MNAQNVVRKGREWRAALVEADPADTLGHWLEAYFRLEAATAASSRQVQRRDLTAFVRFAVREAGSEQRRAWTPRLSRAFVDALRAELTATGQRRYGDRTVNRMLAHLKTFASWVHRHRPFPLGHPTERLPALPTTTLLIDERAPETTRNTPRYLTPRSKTSSYQRYSEMCIVMSGCRTLRCTRTPPLWPRRGCGSGRGGRAPSSARRRRPPSARCRGDCRAGSSTA
jgi:hypothetical protein